MVSSARPVKLASVVTLTPERAMFSTSPAFHRLRAICQPKACQHGATLSHINQLARRPNPGEFLGLRWP
jgi:hypothetical protein